MRLFKKAVRKVKSVISTFVTNYAVAIKYKIIMRNRIKIMNYKKTCRMIEKKRLSISRYGDGEILYMINQAGIGFQVYDEKLEHRLRETLQNPNQNLLLCMPYSLNHISTMSWWSRIYWAKWGMEHRNKIVKAVNEIAPKGYCFGDTQLTRPYVDYKKDTRAKYTYSFFKKLFLSKDVLVVEGDMTKLGVGNDLLASAKSVQRIVVPGENAFSLYDKIYSVVKDYAKNKLVLLALGPTATVLAADLTELGVWCLDVGHLDAEYEWFLQGNKQRSAIAGKFINEVATQDVNEVKDKEIYESQIVVTIKD